MPNTKTNEANKENRRSSSTETKHKSPQHTQNTTPAAKAFGWIQCGRKWKRALRGSNFWQSLRPGFSPYKPFLVEEISTNFFFWCAFILSEPVKQWQNVPMYEANVLP